MDPLAEMFAAAQGATNRPHTHNPVQVCLDLSLNDPDAKLKGGVWFELDRDEVESAYTQAILGIERLFGHFRLAAEEN